MSTIRWCHVISKQAWDGLTEEQQTVIREESKAAGRIDAQDGSRAGRQGACRNREAGVKVTRPDTDAFKALMGLHMSASPNMRARRT
jgi:TRAP-type C4-dicarboxylate transport system substrate-binding protein